MYSVNLIAGAGAGAAQYSVRRHATKFFEQFPEHSFVDYFGEDGPGVVGSGSECYYDQLRTLAGREIPPQDPSDGGGLIPLFAVETWNRVYAGTSRIRRRPLLKWVLDHRPELRAWSLGRNAAPVNGRLRSLRRGSHEMPDCTGC